MTGSRTESDRPGSPEGLPTLSSGRNDEIDTQNDSTGEDNKSTVGSDEENRKVRQKLKKTSIASVKDKDKAQPEEEDSPTDESMQSSPGSPDSKSRSRKRSSDDGDEMYEEIIDDEGNKLRRPVHRRKRSKERELQEGSTSEGSLPTPSTPPKDTTLEDAPGITSPRPGVKKRVREQFVQDLEPEEDSSLADAGTSGAQNGKDVGGSEKTGTSSRPMSRNFTEEHASKRIRESPEHDEKSGKKDSAETESEKKSETKLPPGSGFADTSVASPFAKAAASGKSIFGSGAKPPATPDLFAQSKFGAMSGSSASPFATMKTSSASPFASPVKGGGSSTFGSTGASGFGKLGQGSLFGSPGGGLAFGKSEPKPFGGSLSGKPPKPFGAPDTEDEEEDSDDSGDEEEEAKESRSNKGDEEKKEKFAPTEVFTGEENETTVFQSRGKIYVFDKGARMWKERGMGTIRVKASILDLNDLANSEEKPKRQCRLIARADATYRLILNIPLSKDLKGLYGDKGNEPADTKYNIVGWEDGENRQYIIRTKQAKELHKAILEVLE